VCGGGQRFWRPNNNCWQLVKGFSTWEEIPQIYPVHGAATTFFRSVLDILGANILLRKTGDIYMRYI
jgi:hypothetical protein